jgi:hypothetical protein
MVTAAISTMTNTEQKTITVDDEDDDASIDEEQLEEYREMVEQLGHFPVSGEFGYFPFFFVTHVCSLIFFSFIHACIHYLPRSVIYMKGQSKDQ